jgi:hypothetical protein
MSKKEERKGQKEKECNQKEKEARRKDKERGVERLCECDRLVCCDPQKFKADNCDGAEG